MLNTQGKLLISAFIAILLGVVLIQPIADDIETAKTSSHTILNESVTLSSYTATLANDELISFDGINNATLYEDITGECNITLTTGYLVCNDTVETSCVAHYKYEPDTYVHSGTARVLLTQTRLFFAIAILLVGIGFAIAAFKQGDVM